MQTTSRRLADRKVEKFEKNINKRGAVTDSSAKKGNNLAVGPVLIGFFIFVVIGSCKNASSSLIRSFIISFGLCWNVG